MKIFLILALIILSIGVHAQTNSTFLRDDDSTKEFKTVQIEAKFPGGIKAWTNYLQTNLKSELGAKYLKPKRGETLRQTAIVSFLVDKEGNISEVQILNPDEVHSKLAAETIRVIKEGPKWVPAVQNGKKVIYRQKQSVTWEVVRE